MIITQIFKPTTIIIIILTRLSRKITHQNSSLTTKALSVRKKKNTFDIQIPMGGEEEEGLWFFFFFIIFHFPRLGSNLPSAPIPNSLSSIFLYT